MSINPHIPPFSTELNLMFWFFSFWARGFRCFFTSTMQKTVFATYHYDEIRNFGSYLYSSTTGYIVTHTLMRNDPNSVDMPRYHYVPLHKQYELSNHLGNVLVTVSARPRLMYDLTTYTHKEADVTSVSDYYPFGMLAPGRHWESGSYRFGFNGMEADNEIKGSGNSYDFGARIYDSRVGRFLSIDPMFKDFPDNSPYCFAANSPIYLIDKKGERPYPSNMHLSTVFNAYHNALRLSAKNEGYDYFRSDIQNAKTINTFGSTAITNFDYYSSGFQRTFAQNEYLGSVNIQLSNDKTIKATIWFNNHPDADENVVVGVDNIGLTSAPFTGERGYYFLMRSNNNRLLGFMKFDSKEEYDSMSEYLNQFREQGYREAATDMDKEYDTGNYYNQYYENNFQKERSNIKIEKIENAETLEEL